MSDLKWLDDAMAAYEKTPEKVDLIFMCVYAIAISNCMRALGHWPEKKENET